MDNNHYAYYNTQTGYIENVISCNPEIAPTLVWPDGYSIVEIPKGTSGAWSVCGVGWSFINGNFVEPDEPKYQDSSIQQPISTGAQTL